MNKISSQKDWSYNTNARHYCYSSECEDEDRDCKYHSNVRYFFSNEPTCEKRGASLDRESQRDGKKKDIGYSTYIYIER